MRQTKLILALCFFIVFGMVARLGFGRGQEVMQAWEALVGPTANAEPGQPAQPAAGAIFLASVKERTGFYRTNLGLNNLSGQTAHVTIYLVNSNGIILAKKNDSATAIPPDGMKQINRLVAVMLPSMVGQGVQASVYLESDQPIKAWASEIEDSNNDPSMLVSQRAGSTQILIPSSANSSRWFSSLTLANVSAATASCTIKAYNPNGTQAGSTFAINSIPAYGSVSYPNILQQLGVVDQVGHPLEINSTAPLLATSRVYSDTNTGGFFEGIDISRASLLQYVPGLLETGAIRTNLGINNLGSESAHVLIRFINTFSFEVRTKWVDVPAHGLYQFNFNEIIEFFSQIGTPGIDCYIQLDSNQPVIAWISQINNASSDPGFAISRGAGNPRLLLLSSANDPRWHSTLVIVNPAVIDAYFRLTARDINGEVKSQMGILAIPARGFFTKENILEYLGLSNFYGPIEIQATNGVNILATSRIISADGTSAFFEGQAITEVAD